MGSLPVYKTPSKSLRLCGYIAESAAVLYLWRRQRRRFLIDNRTNTNCLGLWWPIRKNRLSGWLSRTCSACWWLVTSGYRPGLSSFGSVLVLWLVFFGQPHQWTWLTLTNWQTGCCSLWSKIVAKIVYNLQIKNSTVRAHGVVCPADFGRLN